MEEERRKKERKKEGKKRLEFTDTTIKTERVATSLKTLHFL